MMTGTVPVQPPCKDPPEPDSAQGLLRGVFSGISTAVLVLLLVVLTAVVIVPKALGGAGLTVLTGSMEPTYRPGDMVITVPQDHYGMGDVITFQPISGDPMLITHRIVAYRTGPEGISYITQGDANGHDDQPIFHEQVRGKVLYHVPLVGHLSTALGRHRTHLVILLAAGLFTYAAYAITAGTIAARRERNTPNHDLIA